ncbi:tetratricopeptide repeat protein [Shouchella xiaoxiensis]|nr:tetratricopeptide repeat protein [Shouchella xiaoxiensis]
MVTREEVGELCALWSGYLIAQDLEKASEYRQLVYQQLKDMEEDDKIIGYVQLLDLKHNIMEDNLSKGEFHTLPKTQSDYLLDFYYYYYHGRYAFYHSHYKKAVSLFQDAERVLELVDNEMEKAEFYQQCGASYYRIDQHVLATQYTEKAIAIFEKDEFYVIRLLNCYLLLGGIQADLHQYDKAEAYYAQVLEHADIHPQTLGLTYRALGLLKESQDKLEEARVYFYKALAIPEIMNSIFGVKIKVNLVSVLYRLQASEAKSLFKEAEADVIRYNMHEYQLRLDIIHYLFVEFSEKNIDLCLQNLVKLECPASFVAEEVSHALREKGQFELALKYMSFAYKTRINPNMLGRDQE